MITEFCDGRSLHTIKGAFLGVRVTSNALKPNRDLNTIIVALVVTLKTFQKHRPETVEQLHDWRIKALACITVVAHNVT